MNVAAEVFPPGEFLREELEARGWTQVELAEIMGRPPRLINEIIAGKKSITPETAIQLGEALGTGAEIWINLEGQYQLSKVRSADNLISRRARLYEKFPVRDMIKRGWIQASESIDVLEQQFVRFFGISSIDESPVLCHAAKKTHHESATSIQQVAWLCKARAVASSYMVKKYKKEELLSALPKLQSLLSAPEEIRHVGKILAECGVRLVYVEPLPGSKIDGACFWLSSSQPVIAMSLRFDRIDNYWFVLRHEIEHVLKEHGKASGFIIDDDVDALSNGRICEEELIANSASVEFCVSQAELNSFIARVSPMFSDERVQLFARRIGVHPGLVAGQLRKRLNCYNRWSHFLAKIRHIAVGSSPTDGWGAFEQF